MSNVIPVDPTINQSLMQGKAEFARMKSRNENNEYYWMINPKGVKVPVDAKILKDVLGRGYIHTDGQLYSDDLKAGIAAQRRERKPKPNVQIAEAISRLATVQGVPVSPRAGQNVLKAEQAALEAKQELEKVKAELANLKAILDKGPITDKTIAEATVEVSAELATEAASKVDKTK